MNTSKETPNVRICTSCGKEFTLDIPSNRKVCDLILKQDTLCMCDECYKKYLKDQEEIA